MAGELFSKRDLLIAVFCLGCFSLIVQVLFVREMLVLFFGNELSVGTILASWFIGIGLGAWAARIALRGGMSSRTLGRVLGVILLLQGALLPVEICVLRVLRLLLRVPVGEFASFFSVFVSSIIVFLPCCFCVGLYFPFSAELAGRVTKRSAKDVGPVSWIYISEAAGSMAGGIILTYILLPSLSPLRIMAIASCLSFAGAACLMRRWARGVSVALALVCLSASLAYPNWFRNAERAVIDLRWESFGLLDRGQGGTKLVASRETMYQNLALTELNGQYALYGNGRVLFVFPDPIAYEHAVHFIMAQKPAAKSVLLLGGNPLGEIPELLKYPLKRLVFVQLDPGIGKMVASVMPEEYRETLSDARVKYVAEDGVYFVQRCRETFDVILVNAPEPATAAASRYYTKELYVAAQRILNPRGFLHTAVSSSVRLQSETAEVAASVYGTLKEVFPVTLVTAEAENEYFAGWKDSGLTFDRETLRKRSASVAMSNEYFRPEYFLGADELDAEKREFVLERFASVNAPRNTISRPVTYFYNLLLWAKYSGSHIEGMLNSFRAVRASAAEQGVLLCGAFCILLGIGIGRQAARGGVPGPAESWSRLMIGLAIAATGFSGIALEVVLIFVFQNLYGYVYTRMGLIAAVFMLGLVSGAEAGRRMSRHGERTVWIWFGMLEICLIGLAALIPRELAGLAGMGWAQEYRVLSQAAMYASVGLSGWIVGAEFPLANRAFYACGGKRGTSAAVTDAADHAGAALGSFLVGVILIPVMGIPDACGVLVALKGASLMMLLSAVFAGRVFLKG